MATCKLSWCSRPRYREPSGFVHDFCGRTHAELYRKTHGYYGMLGNCVHPWLEWVHVHVGYPDFWKRAWLVAREEGAAYG